MNLNIDMVYVTHWSALTERKIKLMSRLEKLGIESTWIENYDIATWDKEEIMKSYPKIFGLNPSGRFLKNSEISLLLKHCYIIMDAYDKGYNDIMILEDDVIFEDNYVEKFNEYKSQLPKYWDLAFVGGCCGLHISPLIEGVNVYNTIKSRCCHNYIISKSGIKKLSKEINNIDEAIDWYYNYNIPEFGLNTYWFEPTLSYQDNSFVSTVQT